MSIGQKIVNFLKINGITHEVTGDDVEIKDNAVYVDKKEITKIKELDLKIEWIGSLASLTVKQGSVTCGDVEGYVDAGDKVTCGDVGEYVDAGESVVCKNVNGYVDAGESVKAGNVSGNIDAGESVTCGNVGGDIEAGDKVTCGNVGGNIDAGDVICKHVDGDIDADTVKMAR